MRMDDHGMTRRNFLRAGGAAAIGLMAAGLSPRLSWAQQAPPNVLLIMTDQQTLDTISAAGCSEISTPALDRLVERGTYFTHSISPNPLCSPARSSILTGRTSCEAGVYQNGRPIRSEIPNLGQWLSEQAGYEAVYAGKWHLPGSATHFIPGFRVLTPGIPGQGHLGDSAISSACEAWLHNRKGIDPFVMVASFVQPHDICQWLRLNSRRMDETLIESIAQQLPPLPENHGFDQHEPEAVVSRRAGNEGVRNNWSEQQWRYYLWSYYRHVEMVDAEIGRILTALEASGHAGDTLVVFTSDHGEGCGHHQMTRKNFLYEESLAVPLIVSLPGKVPAGRVDTHVASGLDIMPTICDYVGVAPPRMMRGRSLRPLLEGERAIWREFCVSEVNGNTGRALRTDRFKYITYVDDPVEQLFDMEEDPGEMRNLARNPSHADILADHRTLLREWERHLEVPPDTPHPDAWIE